MATSSIFDRAGKVARSITLTADQAGQARTLCDAIRDAQAVMKNKPELDADGRALRGTTSASGVANSASAPDDVFSVLARLDELVGSKDPRAVYAHLNEAVSGEVLRDSGGAPRHGLMLASKNTVPTPPTHAALRAIRPDGNYRQAAYDLGLILSATTSTEFERAEVSDPGPAAGTESGGAKVGGSGAPVIRATVRWMA